MRLSLFSVAFLLISIEASIAQSLTKIWTNSEGIKTPESVLYDARLNLIFVSNINGKPTEKDGNGFISLLGPDGRTIKCPWITGLNAPKGLAISNGNLYVADIDQLVEINIKEAKIVNRFKAAEAIFLNDVTASEDGTIYVSDSQSTKIYKLSGGKLSLWLNNKLLENPNGLWAEKGQLYAGTSKVLQIDLKTKKIKVLVEDCGHIDGLERMADGNFIYSNWEGRIFITRGGKSIKLLDTTDKINTADIDFVPEKNMILVPTFFGNSVDAYKLELK